MNKVVLGIAALILLGLAIVAGWRYFAGKNLVPTVVAPTEKTYQGNGVGVSFNYLDSYELQERNLTINGDMVRILTLSPKGVVIPEGGEGSTAITVAVFEEKKPISLTDWVHSMTNTFPVGADGFNYKEIEVGGQTALAYTSTGLYESDNIAVAEGDEVYVFSVSWLTRDDQILKDFSKLITTVSFTK